MSPRHMVAPLALALLALQPPSRAAQAVEGPQGSVFFKLTGAATSVDAARADLDALVASVRRK